ncbi:hypothetical protein BH10BAC3_BH10BAC3_04020 [soil metagenome]
MSQAIYSSYKQRYVLMQLFIALITFWLLVFILRLIGQLMAFTDDKPVSHPLSAAFFSAIIFTLLFCWSSVKVLFRSFRKKTQKAQV